MEEFQEPLSLATFEPGKAYPPYLTTPRSLEACRMNGVNPVELVEIPVTEFQKDFPNDPDAAQRRFERIDGARRRTLAQVMEDWKLLSSTGWQPPLAERPASAKETIVRVRPDAHCKLLEVQAEKFRKIERDNWDALNRMLRMEVMKADEEQRGKKIIQKQDDIAKNTEELNQRRMRQREQLHREQMERQKRKEEEFWRETKMLQQLDQKYAIEKSEKERQNALKEKQFREQREAERVARTEYTLQLKNSIVHGINSKIDAKKKILALRDKNTNQRLQERQREHQRYLEEKRNAKLDRLEKAREDQRMMRESQRQEMLERIAENEAHRQRIHDEKERLRQEQQTTASDLHKQKLQNIKAASDGAVQEKAERTLRSLHMKEELARQELIKVREAQEKRRRIKAIRQEAYEMAATRARKAEEYRMMKLQQDLHNKEERCKAIKTGFYALNHMRNTLKDIMEKTTTELKNEMSRLRHVDDYDPEKVIAGAMRVGEKTLFPRLDQKFGISQDAVDGAGASAFKKPLQPAAADLFPSDAFGNEATSGVDAMDRTKVGSDGNKGISDKKDTARQTGMEGAEYDPLQILTMTPAQLQQSLLASKERVAERLKADPYGRENIKRPHTEVGDINEGRNFGVDTFDHYYRDHGRTVGSENDSDYGDAILRLPSEDEAYSKTQQRIHNQQNRKTKQSSPMAPLTHSNSADDIRLPETKFNPLDEGSDDILNTETAINSKMNGNVPASVVKAEYSPLPHRSASSRGMVNAGERNLVSRSQSMGSTVNGGISSKKKSNDRTDVNEKAKFLEPQHGEFRREFSKDHPLAKGGTGKYEKELRSGYLPTGLKKPPPRKSPAKVIDSSATKGKNGHQPRLKSAVAQTLDTAAQIERLTYSAQSRVIDPQSRLELLKKQQNATLKRILQEERAAEEEREKAAQSVAADAVEKQRLDAIFAEERRRASERIIAATREHEEVLKQAMLGMMDLGSHTADNRLPVEQKFNASVKTA